MGPLDHVGIAVRRLDEGIARYQLLGLGPESIEDLPAEGVRAAFLPAGDVRLELLESTRADSAIAYYRRFLETPSRYRYDTDPGSRARVLERLGKLYEERGELAEAAGSYRELTRLWKDADPELQPRVAAAEARLSALAPELPEGALVDMLREAEPRPDEGRVGYGAAWR